MHITLETNNNSYHIRGYAAGDILINETHYHRSLIVSPLQLITDWPPQSNAELTEESFNIVMELEVEVVIFGSGEHLQFPSPKILAPFAEKGIGVEVMNTRAACHTYNVLMSEGRKVVAALLIR